MENPDRFVSDIEASKIIGVSPQSLRNWRCIGGRGPAYSKISGRLVRYKVADLLAFMAAARIDPQEVRR